MIIRLCYENINSASECKAGLSNSRLLIRIYYRKTPVLYIFIINLELPRKIQSLLIVTIHDSRSTGLRNSCDLLENFDLCKAVVIER